MAEEEIKKRKNWSTHNYTIEYASRWCMMARIFVLCSAEIWRIQRREKKIVCLCKFCVRMVSDCVCVCGNWSVHSHFTPSQRRESAFPRTTTAAAQIRKTFCHCNACTPDVISLVKISRKKTQIPRREILHWHAPITDGIFNLTLLIKWTLSIQLHTGTSLILLFFAFNFSITFFWILIYWILMIIQHQFI